VASVQSDLWKELEDKIREPVQVQEQELQRMRQALDELNKKLMTLTIMYNNYATPFGLHEGKLEILHCADHRDE
jgi:uncharacterized protein YigA (DUF484 family)